MALIGTAILLPGAAPVLGAGGFTAAGTGFAATSAAIIGNIGIALAFSGLAQMLTPVENIKENFDVNHHHQSISHPSLNKFQLK